MNPNNSKDMARLHRAMEASRRKMEPFRRRHRESIEQYVGVYYSDDAATKPVHVNLMELAANIYLQNLASKPPRVSGLENSAMSSTAAPNPHRMRLVTTTSLASKPKRRNLRFR